MRVALVAGLMLGVVAMHSFGHAGHNGADHGQIVVTAHSAHHGQVHDTESPSAQNDSDPASLLSMLGLVVCGAVIARFAVECFRSASWSRLRDLLIALEERFERVPSQRWLPPPRLEPTGLQVNRIASLRI